MHCTAIAGHKSESLKCSKCSPFRADNLSWSHRAKNKVNGMPPFHFHFEKLTRTSATAPIDFVPIRCHYMHIESSVHIWCMQI